MRSVRNLLPLLVLSTVVLAAGVTGCSHAAKPSSAEGPAATVTTSLAGSPATSDEPTVAQPPVPAGESLADRVMPYEKRKAAMPTGMPIEVPVIDGSVVSTSAAVSDSSWLYTLETSGTIATVGDWYARAYANAQWRVVAHSSTDAGLRLTFRKNGAQTLLDVRSLSKGKVEVHASIGVGQSAPATN